MNCPKCNATLIKSPEKSLCCMACGYDTANEPSEDAIKHADNRLIREEKVDGRRKENKPRKEREEEKKAIKRAKMKQPEETNNPRIAPELLTREPKTDGRHKYPSYSKEEINLIVLACEILGVPEVSKQTGIQLTTVYNWRKEAGFHGHTQNTLKCQSEKRIEKASALITKEDQLREESRQRFNKRQTKSEDEAVEVPMLILGLLEYMPKEGEAVSITRLDAFGDAFRGILKVIYLK